MKATSSDAAFAAVTKPNLGKSAAPTKSQLYHAAVSAASRVERDAERALDYRKGSDIDSGRRARFGAAKAGKVAMNNKLREELGLIT